MSAGQVSPDRRGLSSIRPQDVCQSLSVYLATPRSHGVSGWSNCNPQLFGLSRSKWQGETGGRAPINGGHYV